MREILFRGKRVDNDEWAIGFYIELANPQTGEQESFIQTVKKDGRADALVKVIPETVGQYTGLTDKNGKRIFEGDICKGSLDIIFTVEWDNANGRFLGFTIGDRSISYVGKEPSVEVIGNIHDRQESEPPKEDEPCEHE